MTKRSSHHVEEISSHERYLRLTRLYKALSEINQAIVRMDDEAELFPLVCRVAVDFGGARMAWIGVGDSDSERLVPTQTCGTGTHYVEHIVISTCASCPEGRGPEATAFREGQPVIINHFTQDPMTTPWHEQARHFGWGSGGFFPIQRDARPFALLCVYHHAEAFFDAEIGALFEEVTRDIGFALDNFDRERQRQTALEALQASQRHFRAYFERSMVGMAALLPDHTWLEANASCCRMLGYTQEELSTRRWSELTHPDDIERSEALFNRLVTGDIDEYTLEKRFIRKDGALLYAHVATRAVRNDDGSLAYTVSLMEDITERVHQKQALEAEHELNQRLLDTLPVGVVACDGEGRLSLFNEVARVWHHADVMALAPEQWAMHYHLYEADGTTPLTTERIPLYRALRGETIRDVEMTLIPKGHAPRFLLCNGARLRTHDGRLLGAVVALLDITERVRQKRAMEVSEARFRSLFEEARDAIMLLDEKGFIDCNGATLALFGCADKEGFINHHPGELSPPHQPDGRDSQSAAAQRIREALDTGSAFFEWEHARVDNGAIFPTEVLLSRIETGEGGGLLQAMVRDISERKRAEAHIQHLAFYDALTDLPNRHALEHHLPQAAARTRRHHARYAVGFIDLDDFKPVNDRWGHEVGDDLLKQLAGRFKKVLRETDFVTRLGGDEFVVVFEDLDEKRYLTELSILLDRLHRTVEIPFDLGEGRTALIDMTLGLAIAGAEAGFDVLLRQADAAMYQAKQHKADRTHWWWLAGSAEPEEGSQADIDPFGLDTRALLTNHAPLLERLSESIVEAFYEHLQADSHTSAFLADLNEDSFIRLKCNQSEHFRFIVSPQTLPEALDERSREIGRIHALVGLDSVLLASSFEFYRRLLGEYLDRSPLRAQTRYRLLQIITARINVDLQHQIESIATVRDAYYAVLIEPLPEECAHWHELAQVELDRLGSLPGMRAVMLMRPDTQGCFVVEAAAGPCGDIAAEAINRPEYRIMVNPHHARGQGIVARTWRELTIHDVADYLATAGLAPWRLVAEQNDSRAALAIPVRDGQGHAAAVLALYGAYRHQFSGSEPRRWAESLQHRFEVLWRQREDDTLVVPAAQATLWRERLFNGGLRLYLQPIVDLESGRVVKAEGLARLVLDDGTLVLPGQFLPLLGANELYRLFWLTLTQAIDYSQNWRDQGLDWSISINLPPSCLLETDLVARLEEQLIRGACPAGRLILEVLESESITQPQQALALRALKTTGVELALDDLGAGYASLLRVIRDPLDVLKIDQNLVRQLPEDPLPTLALLRALINLTRDLGRELVVEGLETPGLLEVVQQLGATLGQGYGIARPMLAEDLPGWAEAFTLPVHRGQITTFAGALARHWAWRHLRIETLSTSYADCPITAFLHSQGLEDAEAAHWHRCVHTGGEQAQDCADRLLAWLVEQVRGEGIGEA